MNDNKQRVQRAILGGGCISLIVAVIIIVLAFVCCLLDKIFTT